MAGPLIPLISMSIAALRALGTKAARKEFSLSTDTSDDGFGLYDDYIAGDQYYWLPRVKLKANAAYALFIWNDKIGLASRRTSSHRTTYEKLVKYYAKYLGDNT